MRGAGWPTLTPGASPRRMNHHSAAVVTTAMARAMRIGRRGVTETSYRAPYWRVALPVMLGWTVHMKVYDPAASGGTSYTRVSTPGKISPL